MIRLSNSDNSVDLPGAQIIGISSTAQSERHSGEAMIRFQLKGDDAMGAQPFDSIIAWQEENANFALETDELAAIEGCLVRECSLDISNRALYIQLFVPVSAQQLRHWFAQ